MNNKHLLAACLFLAANSVSAAVVTLYDGTVFDYNPNDTYIFDANLTVADPTVTIGAILELGEVLSYTITAPADFGLYAMVTPGPDFGDGFLGKSIYDCIVALADPTCNFVVSEPGDVGFGYSSGLVATVNWDVAEWWVVPALIPNNDAMVYAGTSFDFELNGNLPGIHWLTVSINGIPEAMAYLGAEGAYDLTPPPSAVPVPAAAWLFGSGLLGLVGIAKRKRVA